ncbi:hypothetical protein KFK09_009404 [Dendrobium nobile]|uniref:Uncharacterized protein n=1 Tax=Dendrobium nobile TaxID=94219 RepID=A0A8T3BH26_DENNO|nr:hypothetical protein KFK09_009404 [Dendrobium nobile]
MWFKLVQAIKKKKLDQREESQSQKNYRNMEAILMHAVKLPSKTFLHLLQELSRLSSFCKLRLGILSRMEKYMKVKVKGKRSEKIQELVLELLKFSLSENQSLS